MSDAPKVMTALILLIFVSICAGSQNHIHSFHAHFGLARTDKQISSLQSAFLEFYAQLIFFWLLKQMYCIQLVTSGLHKGYVQGAGSLSVT